MTKKELLEDFGEFEGTVCILILMLAIHTVNVLKFIELNTKKKKKISLLSFPFKNSIKENKYISGLNISIKRQKLGCMGGSVG